MHRTRLFGLMALILGALLIFPACSDDDDPAAPTNVGTPPEFDLSDLDTYEIPAAMETSSDPAVQEMLTYLETFDWIDFKLGRLEPPATKAGPWIYTWTEGEPGYDELTYTLTIRELAESFSWELRSTGTMWEVVYTNYLMVAAEIAKDRSWGGFKEYNYFGSGELTYAFSWMTEDGILTAMVDIHDPFAPYRIVAEVHPDTSGSLSYYNGVPGEGWLWKEFVWDATGAGTWTEYDSEGSVVGSGTFGGPTG